MESSGRSAASLVLSESNRYPAKRAGGRVLSGYKRFLEFFSTHICNNTCKKLGLVHPRKKININVDETFFSGKNVANALLCKCCSLPIRKSDMLLCCICSCQEIRTKTKAVCSVCNTPFIYSSYINNCQLNPTPDKCEKCSPKF